MAKNKKPRKRYRPKGVSLRQVPADDQKKVLDIIRNMRLIVELKLPKGLCSKSDIGAMRDFINWASALVVMDEAIDRPHFEANYAKDWQRLTDGFRSYYGRHLKTGSVTATGGELNAIRDGFDIVGAVIEGAFKEAPLRTLEVYNGMKEYEKQAEKKESK